MSTEPQKQLPPAAGSAKANPSSGDDLQTIYSQRFAANQAYRQEVWRVLIANFFQKYIGPSAGVLDLGCGYGEFINQIAAGKKYGMDLNADTAKHLAAGITFLQQDCSQPWPLPENSLDTVFTSNFFEHLPDKATLGRTLEQARRSLKTGGRVICLGPNIKYLPGKYWDFWDHYLPLTELSLSEGLRNRGFAIERCEPRFLPYTMVSGRQYPLVFIRLYLRLPVAWRFLGKQFLVVARKP
jgi:SAM-dependent methyltransferase